MENTDHVKQSEKEVFEIVWTSLDFMEFIAKFAEKRIVMMDNDIYAIGQQDFKTLREDNALYIDKTAFVDKIARSKSKYIFMARPRRFGKSLFLSTLKYFFEGERGLFKGLYIDSIDFL